MFNRLIYSFFVLSVMGGSFVAEAKAKAARASRGRPPSGSSSGESGDYVVEKRADGSTVKYKKKTSYDFEGVGIDGISNKPSGSYVSNIKDVKAKSIIRLRENFDAEVIDSARQ
mgnify:CR=1 FL=1|jgi:hypothetical protein